MRNKVTNFLKKYLDKTALRYLIVGLINTAIGAAISFTCFNVFHLSVMQSTACDYFFGSIISYFLHKHFTFQKTDNNPKRIMKFALSIAICWFVAFKIAEPIVGLLLSQFSASLQGNISIIFGKILYVGLSYFLQRIFVFN